MHCAYGKYERVEADLHDRGTAMSVGEHEVSTAGVALIYVNATEVDVDFENAPVTRHSTIRPRPSNFTVVDRRRRHINHPVQPD